MRPLTEDRPKGLVEVAGRPLLAHCFDALLDVGVDELVVVVGYRAENLLARFGDEYRSVPVTYVHQRERLGLAHALQRAEPQIDGTFVAMNGDNVCRANLDEAIARHREADADATMLVERVSADDARKTSVFELDGGTPVGIVEKPDEPPSRLVPRGFYVFDPVVFHACQLVRPSERGEFELTDAIDLLFSAGRPVETVPLEGWCYNVNEPDDRAVVAEKLAE